MHTLVVTYRAINVRISEEINVYRLRSNTWTLLMQGCSISEWQSACKALEGEQPRDRGKTGRGKQKLFLHFSSHGWNENLNSISTHCLQQRFAVQTSAAGEKTNCVDGLSQRRTFGQSEARPIREPTNRSAGTCWTNLERSQWWGGGHQPEFT